MANIKIILDPGQITPGAMFDLQELTRCYLRDFLAKFICDEEGKPLNKWDALKYLDEFGIDDLRQAMNELQPQLEALAK